jgi:hypothetical protein
VLDDVGGGLVHSELDLPGGVFVQADLFGGSSDKITDHGQRVEGCRNDNFFHTG